MDKETFWATKNPGAQFETITFEHPAFDAPTRLVRNVFAPVTLGGNEYTPAPMTIKTPDKEAAVQPKLQIAFPRQVVGREFKRQLRLIAAAGSLAPIVVTYGLWLAETDAPKVTWVLYVSDQNGVGFDATSVQVSASLDNPLRRQIALIYTPDVFTGLEIL